MIIEESWKIEENLYKCPHCSKSFSKKGLGYHIWKNHGEGINFIPFKDVNISGRSTWNKGKTKENHPSLMSTSETLKGKYASKELVVQHTPESKKLLSEAALKRNLGGVRQSKRIEYNGKVLGSSYELAVAKSLDENNITWDTCKRIRYIDPFGKERTYTPDFYLFDYDVYLDPKNDFLIEKINPALGFNDLDKIKLVEEQHNIRIIVLNNKQLEWDIIRNLI